MISSDKAGEQLRELKDDLAVAIPSSLDTPKPRTKYRHIAPPIRRVPRRPNLSQMDGDPQD